MTTPNTPNTPRHGTAGNALVEGWAYSPHDDRLHYFRTGRSLCGRQILWPADRHMTAEPINTLDTCPPCTDAIGDPDPAAAPDTGTPRQHGQHEPDPPPPLARPDPLAP